MKVKTILICISFVLGLLLASCSGASKICPAYSDADVNDNVEVTS